MRPRVYTACSPGNGERVRIVSPVTGREWTGVVLQWTHGCPQVRTDDKAEIRYFPHDWVTEVTKVTGP